MSCCQIPLHTGVKGEGSPVFLPWREPCWRGLILHPKPCQWLIAWESIRDPCADPTWWVIWKTSEASHKVCVQLCCKYKYWLAWWNFICEFHQKVVLGDIAKVSFLSLGLSFLPCSEEGAGSQGHSYSEPFDISVWSLQLSELGVLISPCNTKLWKYAFSLEFWIV